ncbi:GntR family transcriptional regulator [Streptomyces sp. XY593]|uniref:GntR family transcriptional regulator n=1 Tax=Streptomyces sp. XY593 TaxID=1519483 RepID=UPI0006AF46FB|nr:GntR family transcriptional regulator [Streptomyces sp. XY593]
MPSRRHAIADDLRHQISSGHFKAGERLPSEAQLATQYAVSTSTLRNALALLQGEGLVEKIHGNGNFVRHPLRRITYAGGAAAPASWATFSAHLRMIAQTASIEVPSHLSTLLNVPPRSNLTEVLFTTDEGRKPRGLAYIYIPRDLAPATRSVVGQITVRPPDARPVLVEVQERVSARLPTQAEAGTLRISPTVPVLSLTRVSTDATGHVIEAASLVLPGDAVDALFTTRFATEERNSKE